MSNQSVVMGQKRTCEPRPYFREDVPILSNVYDRRELSCFRLSFREKIPSALKSEVNTTGASSGFESAHDEVPGVILNYGNYRYHVDAGCEKAACMIDRATASNSPRRCEDVLAPRFVVVRRNGEHPLTIGAPDDQNWVCDFTLVSDTSPQLANDQI